MARDVSQSLLAGTITPGPADLIFAGPPDAIVLSVQAEGPFTLRRRRLGYGLHAHDFMLREAGPPMNVWQRANFEQVERGPDARCIPDGTHQNGELQTEIRAEILRILRARKTPGFV